LKDREREKERKNEIDMCTVASMATVSTWKLQFDSRYFQFWEDIFQIVF